MGSHNLRHVDEHKAILRYAGVIALHLATFAAETALLEAGARLHKSRLD
jgi:hypothetical protein